MMFPKIRTNPCCNKEAPLFPMREPNTSIAALPLTFDYNSVTYTHKVVLVSSYKLLAITTNGKIILYTCRFLRN